MIYWRRYRTEDGAALKARHEAECARAGFRFEFPALDDPRYLMCEVAERDGQPVAALVVHATVEVMLIGADAAVARAAVEQAPLFAERLRAIGADEAHAFVPKRLMAGMAPLLRRAGFRASNADYVPYYREI